MKYAYVSSYVGCTYIILFTCIINRIQKKENQSSAYFFQLSYPHPSLLLALWICIPSIKRPATSKPQKKSQIPNFYLLDKDFVDESTSKDDMEILFKQLKRLTKVAPVYFVYGNHKSKTKFTKNNITILNDQEVHLNNIILIGRSDYTNKNRKKTKD